MTIIPKLCENCGKPLGLFDGRFCVECIQGVKQALNEVKHEQTQAQDGDRVVSLNNRINDLINAIEIDECGYWTPIRIVSVLKQLPSVEPQDGDLISRQAVLDLCGTNRYDLPYNTGDRRGYDEGRIINMTKLKLLPSVSQSQGHWINNDNGTMSCSECHTWFSRDCQSKFMNYCGYCGTRMEGNNDGR